MLHWIDTLNHRSVASRLVRSAFVPVAPEIFPAHCDANIQILHAAEGSRSSWNQLLRAEAVDLQEENSLRENTGGHHRIPEKEVDRFLYLANERGKVSERRRNFRRISGRNQLVGRVTGIKVNGLIAQVTMSIGDQRITSIIAADAVREMHLKLGQTATALIKSTEVMIIRM